jgi:hypothetical protein
VGANIVTGFITTVPTVLLTKITPMNRRGDETKLVLLQLVVPHDKTKRNATKQNKTKQNKAKTPILLSSAFFTSSALVPSLSRCDHRQRRHDGAKTTTAALFIPSC